ncbi:unnamed protein product [Phaedon cochleariae]|uniref:PDZ domain-containing protein n=1 Tax=Phaedon cochleariae TaxID=80249 RepID=A0A9P0GS42_PHACE|nr:unnamed protein product [Phaedon cochleariae]
MMATEYPTFPHRHRYACSTMSSETLSGSCGSRNNRVRTVRLARRGSGTSSLSNGRQSNSLGFSLRGGHEHGTGFFVSHVEVGTEAHGQGLRVGDQIIRINGFTIEDAVHKEVLQLISSHTHLTLKVRSVGMIPVKDKKTDILSWQIISDTNSSSRSSPQFVDKNCDIRINIMVAPRSKLGCGICKGPEWKPGIFVQFTKEGGIAREAGLRPGDQILQCNNVDFLDIPFNEAVSLMKNSRQLDLVIRKASSAELFPGESSGYNSSASSVTEDQSPSWSDSKRLSMVKEENQNLGLRFKERLAQKDSTSTKWSLSEWDEEPIEKSVFKPTIINLSENGTTIRINGYECQTIRNEDDSQIENNGNKVRTVLPKVDTKTVVEVHRSDEVEHNNPPNRLMKSSSNSSLTSKASFTSAASSSLSSAISMEIQRRVKIKTEKPEEVPIDEQIQKKKLLRSISTDQQFQHSKLMNEFKQAHQKMFKSNGEVDCPKQDLPAFGKETMERLAHKELSQKLSDKLLNLASTPSKDDNTLQKDNAVQPPPPPPPPQLMTADFPIPTPPKPPTIPTNTLKVTKTKPKAPPVPAKTSTLSFRQPPPCPTPDYDTLSLSSTSSTIKPSQKHEESVEMDSLDSYKIQNPANSPPKPPSTYFQSSSMSTEKSKGVSVTIGEYGTVRSSPRRLNFLKKESSDTRRWENSLASELTHTLNRSNLRKRTESMDDLLSSPQIKPQSNGTIRISVNNLSRGFAKSTNDLTEDFESTSSSRTMVNIDQGKQSYG